MFGKIESSVEPSEFGAQHTKPKIRHIPYSAHSIGSRRTENWVGGSQELKRLEGKSV